AELPLNGQGETNPMFAITGITGKVGGEVARNLLAGNQPVRAVVRDLRKAKLGHSLAATSCVRISMMLGRSRQHSKGPKACSCSFRRTSIRRQTFTRRGPRPPR